MQRRALPLCATSAYRASLFAGSREYGIYKEYDKFNTKTPCARRATYLIDANGKVVEMQVDSEAIDPSKTVAVCELRKLKR
jgi:peroxiredoxin